MKKFINYLVQEWEQNKLTKTQIYYSVFATLLFLGLAIFLPLINSNLSKNQNITKSHAAAPSGYNLSWSDEFNSLALDIACNGSNTWADYFCGFNTRRLDGNSDDGIKMHNDWKGINPPIGAKTIQQVLSESGWTSPSLHEASNGTLKLRAYPIPPAYQNQFNWNGATNPSAASMITAEKSHSQTYGYWEVRAKLNETPKNKHFSIWLLPQDGTWPPEIDLLETVIDINNQSAGILSSANSHGESPDVPITFFSPQGGMLNAWHTYGFEWTQTNMTWYLDGQVVRTHPNSVNKPMYVLATWEIGGNWSGNTDSNTPWPGEIELDYVRVYTEEQGATPTPTSINTSTPTNTPTPTNTSSPTPSDSPTPTPTLTPTQINTPTPTSTPTPTLTPTPNIQVLNGLTGVYYNNNNLTGTTVTRIDPTVNFKWGTASPISGISQYTYSVAWTGNILPKYTETYRIYFKTDDGARVWVNGIQLINSWKTQSATEYSGSINLTKGQKYTIRIEYFQNYGGSEARLSWSSRSQVKQIVPQSQLLSK